MKMRKIVYTIAIGFGLMGCGAATAADIPPWWYSRGVINTQQVNNDYAPVNAGQLKNVAYQTWVEVTNQLAQVATNGNYVKKSGDTITGSLSIASNLIVGIGTANGLYAVAEGYQVTALGAYSHAEGEWTTAGSNSSHAEGERTSANGGCSHAEGWNTAARGAFSHAEGGSTTASGDISHAEGLNTTASGEVSHAEGDGTLASGSRSHAAGTHAKATNHFTYVWSDGTDISSTTTNQFTVYAAGGIRLLGGAISGNGAGLTNLSAGAETDPMFTNSAAAAITSTDLGNWNTNAWSELQNIPAELADGDQVGITNELDPVFTASVAAGITTNDLNAWNTAETDPVWNNASGAVYSAISDQQSAIGNLQSELSTNYSTIAQADGIYVSKSGDIITGSLRIVSNLVVGTGTANGQYAVAEGSLTTASGDYSHAEGYATIASGGSGSHAEGSATMATGTCSHAEGDGSKALAQSSHAEGEQTTASGLYTHAEGLQTTASGDNGSHAEGNHTIAAGAVSHAEGYFTSASGTVSHAEGLNTYAIGNYSHAEGNSTRASGESSHAEGESAQATAVQSHAEGGGTIASGTASHAEGQNTTANGSVSHAEGNHTTASGDFSHAAGWNANATNNYTYVWSDGANIGSTAANQYTVYAQNGIRLLGGPISGNGSGLSNLNLSAVAQSGSFTVGGASSSFYPVKFQNLAGVAVSSDLMVYRDDTYLGGTNTWLGTFQSVISFHPSCWGNFNNSVEKIIYQTSTGSGTPYNDPIGDIADGSGTGTGRDLIIWLRGGGTYQWKNLQSTGPWALLDGNAVGGNIVNSSGATCAPITSQSAIIMKAKNSFYTVALGLGTEGNLHVGGNVTEGYNTTASGNYSHAEGVSTIASGYASHAEGHTTVASGYASHAAGKNAKATNDNTYVWSDGTDISSTVNAQYTVYAQNGIRLLGGPISGNGAGLTNLNVLTTESDPIWVAEKTNYSTTSQADGIYVNVTGDTINGSLNIASNLVVGKLVDSYDPFAALSHGIYWSTNINNASSYGIYRESAAAGSSPNLRIAFETGIKIAAGWHSGMIFYSDTTFGAPIFSVGWGDYKVRAYEGMCSPVFYALDNPSYFLAPANSGTSAAFAGKVGIGTTSPTAALDLRGDLSLQGSLSIKRTAVSSATPYIALTTDLYIGVTTTGAFTVNLPPAATAGSGKVYIIKRESNSATTLTIDPDSSETIDGAATYSTAAAGWTVVRVICTGSAWMTW